MIQDIRLINSLDIFGLDRLIDSINKIELILQAFLDKQNHEIEKRKVVWTKVERNNYINLWKEKV